MKRTALTLHHVAIGAMLLSAIACSTQMQNDDAQDSIDVDSTMINPMNPDSDDVAVDTLSTPASPSDTMNVDTTIMEMPM